MADVDRGRDRLVGDAEPARRSMSRFGDELRRRGVAAGVAPRAIARRTGLDEETVLAIQSGTRLPASENDARRMLAAARATPPQIERAIQVYRDLAGATSTPSPGVFLSYRRSDEPAFAGRIYDRLTAAFGTERVFMDVDSIELGRDFAEALDEALGRSAVLVAVIGSRWVEATGADGRRRLDDPDDYVRMEVERALSRDIRVIPVLVDGCPMPAPSALPVTLAPLVRRQAQTIFNARFGADCIELASTIERILDTALRSGG
jgi:hypothetical protein